jgi:hypothetical protein
MTKRYFKFTDGTRTIFRGTGMVQGFRYGNLSPRGWIAFSNTVKTSGGYENFPAVEIAKGEFDALVALKKARVEAAGRDNKYDSSPQDMWVFNADLADAIDRAEANAICERHNREGFPAEITNLFKF